jgi:thiol:disulfide interchange protein DsbD
VNQLISAISGKVLIFALCVLCGEQGLAQPVEAHHARVELLSEQASIVSNRQLWLGVHFLLEKDWHIYWTNPGDSGQPPVLNWQLPTGFHAGEIRWPRPEKLKHSQSADYGYRDEVLLLVPVHTPNGLQRGTAISFGVEVKWLICREVCIADHAQLHLQLPVGPGAASDPGQDHAKLFAGARRLLPKQWPAGWKAYATSGKDDFVLSIQTGKPLYQGEFFPLEPSQIDNGAPQPLQATAHGARITLKKSDQLLKPVSELKGLLALPGGDAYQIVAPVSQR